MSFPQTPRDIVAELFVGSAWVDITSDVQQRDSITISRGRSSESAKVQPSSCSLTLNNRSGRYSPRNPLSPYYGQLGRNTPLRLAVRLDTDTFNRTSTNTWGNSDAGRQWVGVGTGGSVLASDFNVGSGVATHSVPTVSAYRMSYLSGFSQRDVDVAVTVRVPGVTPIGAAIEPANLLLRAQDVNTYYMARVVVNTDKTVTAAIAVTNASGVSTVLAGPVTVVGLTWTTAMSLRVRFQAEGNSLRLKVWSAANSEPYEWTVTFNDGVNQRITKSGFVGIRSGVAGGNTDPKPISFSYDDFEVRSPRFTGEVSSWPAKWDTSGNDAYVQIEASGVMRRLGQGAAPLQSTLRRYIPTTNPIAYWPLEEDKRAVVGDITPAVGNGSLSYVAPTSGTTPGKITWAADQNLPGSLQAPDLTGGGSLVGYVSGDGMKTGWTLTWAQKMSTTSGSFSLFDTVNSAIQITPILDPGTPTVLNIYLTTFGFSGPIMSYTFPSKADVDGVWHHYALVVGQYGTAVGFDLYIDGVWATGASRGATTMDGLNVIQFSSPASSTTNTGIGHVVVYAVAPDIAAMSKAAFGFPREKAGVRMQRLCQEEGVPLSFTGDPAATQTMGPQRVDTLLNLLQDCADVDMGTLFESRGTVGLVFRKLSTCYNQTPVATVDYSKGELAPPFEPVDDDQLTRNDVTVKRTDGGDYQVSLDTGRMSTKDPSQGGVGRYDTSVTVNVETDRQLPDLAGWRLALGTVDEARYPDIHVDLANPDVVKNAVLSQAMLDVSVDDRVVVTKAVGANIYDDISQLVRGYTETLNAFQHTFRLNCSPESPYQVAVTDDPVLGRIDSSSSTVNTAVTSTTTTLVVKSTAELWTTASGDMPIPITVGGEEMTVTAISGAASPQTFTVTRSVNGVVKSHAVGEEVHVSRQATLAL